jgi:hypothetical protein
MRLFTHVLIVAAFSFLATSSAYTQTLTMSTPDQCVQPGDTISVDVLFDGFTDIVGAQFSLAWDTTVVDYIDIGNFAFGFISTNFNFSFTGTGNLGFLWFTIPGENLPPDQPFFTLDFVVVGAGGTSSDIIITNFPVNPIEFSQGFPPVAIPYLPALNDPIGTITVDGPPMAVCQDVSITLSPADSTASIVPALVDGGSSDDCQLDSLSVSPDMFDFGDIGNNTVTLTAYDNTGNTGTCTATVTVFPPGGPGPVAICQDITIALDANGSASIVPADIDGGSAGNGTLTFSINQSDFDCMDVGNNTVTLSVTDDDATATCNATVTVEDVDAPDMMCTGATVILDGNGQGSIQIADIDNGTTDNCGITSLALSQTDFTCADVGAPTVTLTATDPSGNTGSCEVTVNVIDDQLPSINCQDITVQLDASGTVVIDPASISPTSSDNCPPVGLSLNVFGFDCSSTGANTVVLTATDNSGNTTSCSATVTVEDVDAPAVACEDITIQLDTMTNMASIVPADVGGATTDNCNFTATVNPNSFDMNDLGDNIVTYTATDDSGNSASCTAVVLVLSGFIEPEAVCQDITVQLEDNGEVTVLPEEVDGGSTSESTLTLSLSQDVFTCDDIGDNNVELYAQDQVGIDTCIAVITVEDDLPPVMNCLNPTVQLDTNGRAVVTPAVIDGGTTDNCGLDTLYVSQDTFLCTDVGMATVTLTAIDENGNMNSCDAMLTIEDILPPVAVCQSVAISVGSSGQVAIPPNAVDGGSTDNCGIDSLAVFPEVLSCSDIGINIVTLTVFDVNGNSSTCEGAVNLQDTEPPVAICQDVTVALDANGTATVPAAAADNGSSDNCTNGTLSLVPNTFDCSNLGVETAELIVLDGSGNSDTCEVQVTIEDNLPPVAVCQTTTLYLDGFGNRILNPIIIDGGSTDNCSIIAREAIPSQFGCDDLGPVDVQLVVTDPEGTKDTCTTTITVADTLPPNAFCQNATLALDTNGLVIIDPVSIGGGASNDNCDSIAIEVIPPQFTCDDLGDNPVQLVAMDASGNTDTCTSVLTIIDDILPEVVCQDITVQLDMNGEGMIIPADVDGGSSDNCLIDNLSVSQTDFNCDDVGPQMVILTAQDNSGNTADCTATVSVEDNIAPVAVCQDVTLDIGVTGTVTVTGAQIDGGSTDNCTIDLLTADPFLFDCDDLGPQVSTLTVTDLSGNASTCTANVLIESKADLNIQCQGTTLDLNSDGIAEVDPDVIFAGGGDICGSEITFTVTPTSFDCTQQGDHLVTLLAVDEEGDTDSCTVTVTVQDALPPDAVCQNINLEIGLSGQVAITAQQVNGGSFDNCGNVSLLGVAPEVFSCDDVGLSQATLTVQDAAGNTATCTSTVTVTDIIAPVANCQNISVELDDNGEVSVNPQFIGDNTTDNCNNLFLSLSQQNFDCGDIGVNQVVLTASDQSDNISTCISNITVRDLPDNNVECKSAVLQLNGAGIATVTPADVLTELPETSCGLLNISLSQTTFDCDDLIGANQVSVSISDAIGPILNCFSLVVVEDILSPVLTCKDITVSVSANGTVDILPVDVINTLSDNCEVISTTLSESSFDCSDIGVNPVTLTATDQSGNTSTCQSNVTINAGSALNALCQDIGVELDEFGMVTVPPSAVDAGSSSSCGDPILSLSQSVFDCDDIGDNVVTLTVSNTAGNTSTCTATIFVEDNTPPFLICQDYDLELNADGNGFIIPTDVIDPINTVDNCGDYTVTSATPTVFDCSNIGPNEVAVTVVDGSGNPANCVATVNVTASPGLGLSALVTTTPESDAGAMDGSAAVNVSGGSGLYTFQWSNGGAGSVINNLSAGVYTVTVTDETNGCQVVESGVVGIGAAVTFIADDVSGEMGQTINIPVTVEEFNNVSAFQFSLHVVDNTVAEVVAVTNINPAIAGPVTSVIGNDITMQWTGGGPDGVTLGDGTLLFNIEVDLVGPGGSSSLVIFDNNPLPVQVTQSIGGGTQNASVITEDGSVSVNAVIEYTISGQFVTDQNLPVKNVDVTMTGTMNGFLETGSNGNYSFSVPEGSNATITPVKDTAYLNGVTTFDLVRITEHILGVNPFDSPYRVIAADATGDEMVTTFDIVVFRQLILQIIPSLPNNDSWRFVRADHVFPNILDPWTPTFPEFSSYVNVMQDFSAENYIAIKIGDATGDVNPQAFGDIGGDDRNGNYNGTLELLVKDDAIDKGVFFDVPVYASNFVDLLGYQFGLAFDSEQAELLEVLPGALPDLSKESFGLNRAEEGRILTSWFTAYPQNFSPEEPLFTLRFRSNAALQTGDLLRINSEWLTKEAYSADTRRLDIQLKADPSEVASGGFFVNQNQPNPFSSNTVVTYWLPEAAEVSFTLLNASGQELGHFTEQRKKGFGNWTIDKSTLDGAGIYYYMISTPFGTEVRKMVCVE